MPSLVRRKTCHAPTISRLVIQTDLLNISPRSRSPHNSFSGQRHNCRTRPQADPGTGGYEINGRRTATDYRGIARIAFESHRKIRIGQGSDALLEQPPRRGSFAFNYRFRLLPAWTKSTGD